MGNVTSWNEVKAEIEKRKKELEKENSIIEKAKNQIKKGVKWVTENPEKVAAIATSTLLVVKTVNKVTGKAADWHHRELTQWDPSSRQQLTLRRPMTAREKTVFAARISNGDKTYDILKDMKLIRM